MKNKLFLKGFMLIFFMLAYSYSLVSQTYIPITNYHNGISIQVNGTEGTDFIFDRYYHDPLINDTGLCYIKSDANIELFHNENNSRIDASSTVIIGGDFGDIRYKVDRDWQQMYWASDNIGRICYPKYTGPISFDDLEYEPGISVVGTIGFNPGVPLTDRENSYSRGLVDEAGNEYHYFTYADDDDAEPNWKNPEMSASDGKSMLFCVNPKTPAIWLTASTPEAEYYTTPGKIYWIPKFHEQISYVTDNVSIQLKNIMNSDPVNYKINGGNYIEYTEPINSNSLSTGEHILEFYYDENYIQTRKIIKNPDHPSKNDTFADGGERGYLLWKDEAEFLSFKDRMLNGVWSNTDYYSTGYFQYKNGFLNPSLDYEGNQGIRNPGNIGPYATALMFTMVGVLEGVSENIDYMNVAKTRIMNSPRMHIENVGWETNHAFDPNPSHELSYRGYYDDWEIWDNAFAYDLLVKHYRSDQHVGGITPIEDYRIRDMLAETIYEGLLTFGGFKPSHSSNVDPTPLVGMWSTARQNASMAAALAMPSYNTNYYGTSGFDGASASNTWTPYPDIAVSWKDAYFSHTDKDNPAHVNMLQPFPNKKTLFNWFDGTLNEGLVREDGNWHDRVGYGGISQMGHGIEIFYNIMKRKFDMDYPNLNAYIKKSAEGTVYAYKDQAEAAYPRRMMANEYFPELAPLVIDAHDENEKYFYRSRGYYFFFHNPDWNNNQSSVPVTNISITPSSLNLQIGETSLLSIIIEPGNATNKSVNWSTSDPNVATVDQNGQITALAEGNTIITATTVDGNLSSNCNVQVTNTGNGTTNTIFAESAGIGSAATITAYTGWDNGTPILYSGGSPALGTNLVQTETPSDTYNNSSGGSNIYIKGNSGEAGFLIIEGINTSGHSDIELSFGFMHNSATVRNSFKVYTSTDSNETWTELTDSGDYPDYSVWGLMTYQNIPSSANLNLKFEITQRKDVLIDDIAITGTATMIPVSGVSLTTSNLNLIEGEHFVLVKTISPVDATDKNVIWSTNNPNVATVDQNGQVTAISEGNAIITVTTTDGEFTASCNVTIGPPTPLTIYIESAGTGANTISTYTGWDNKSPVVYSGGSPALGTSLVQTQNPSDTYPNASGSSNIYVKGNSGDPGFLIIEGINTASFANIKLSFGFWHNSATVRNNFKVYASTDSHETWTELNDSSGYPNYSTWGLMTYPDIPSSPNLSLKFEITQRKDVFIDDISITGTSISNNVQLSNLGMVPETSSIDIVVYPNPIGSDFFNIRLSGFKKESLVFIKIFDLLGKEIYINKLLIEDDSSTINIPTKSLNKGIYMLSVSNDVNKISKKLIVE